MRGKALQVEERDGILRGIGRGWSGRDIALGLGCDPSVVSREIARNGGRDNYRVHAAQERFEALRARPKPRRLEIDQRLGLMEHTEGMYTHQRGIAACSHSGTCGF